MSFVAPLLFAGILGALFTLFVTRSAALPHYILFVFSMAFPAGLALCSLILFGSYLFNSKQAPLLTILIATSLGLFFLAKLIHAFFRTHAPIQLFVKHCKQCLDTWKNLSRIYKIILVLCSLLWLSVFFKLLLLFRAISIANIFGGWDAMFFWHVKARFFFLSPADWKNMFSSSLSWTHPDYPLLLPASVAWGWNWTHQELQIWPAIVAFVFYFSTVLFMCWYLVTTVNAISALLGSAFFMTISSFSFWSITQLADMPLAFFFTASGLILTSAFRTKNSTLFFLAGWMAGCATWTKNEGLFFAGWLTLLSLFIFWKDRKNDPHWKSHLINLCLGIAIPFFATFILKHFLAKGSGDYLGSGRGIWTYLQAIFMDWQKTKIILMSFPIYMRDMSSWNGLWILVSTAGVLGIFGSRLRSRYTWISAALVCLIEFGYFLILHTSPHNVIWQMQTAMPRLVLHSGVLALIFTFEIYGKLMNLQTTERPSSPQEIS